MPTHKDSSDSPKKHKVIHWNPEDDENQANDAGSNKTMFGTIAIVAILVAGALGFYAISGKKSAEEAAVASGTESQTNRQTFTSRSKADFARDTTTAQIEAARQTPATHTVLIQKLIAIEKEFQRAGAFMDNSDYTKAFNQYERVSDLLDDFSLEVKNKQLARELYDNFLFKVKDLEKKKHLNETAYESAFEAASTGKEFLDQGSFSVAKRRLDEATAFLEELENTIQEYVETNAAQGQRFIAQGKGEQAVEAFMNVLKMNPDNEEAIKQLERAKYAEKTYNLLVAAKTNEEQGQLEVALENFQQAFQTDKRSAKAQQGVSRVRRKIQDRDFNFHYAEASTALAELRYTDAIAHLEEALKVFPNRQDIAAAIQKARIDKHQSDIVAMVTEAYALEGEYKWTPAREIYKQLLQLEPELDEAKNGMLRTGKMIRSILRYEKLIEVAKIEAKSLSFQQAIRTFDTAMRSKPAYLELTPENDNLRRYLQLQSKPVQVQIISDSQTWVSIEGPSKFKPQKIEEDVFNLLPGRYLILGRKKNYQDVRYSIIIRGGTAQDPLEVVADERRG